MLAWRKEYETGHDQIDHEHNCLLQQLNKLEIAIFRRDTTEQLETLLEFMEQYIKSHFENEEKIFACYNCRAAGLNQSAHQNFIILFQRSKERLLTEGASIGLANEIHELLLNWVTNHILMVDTELKPCIRKNPDRLAELRR